MDGKGVREYNACHMKPGDFPKNPDKPNTLRENSHMSLYIHYKPTKVDLVRGILEYWDPVRARDTDDWYDLYYNYEAETICQSLRRNSKVESVAGNIKKLIDRKLEMEGREYRIDMENAKRVAASMIEAVKRMK